MVEGDHARRHRLQHGLGVAPALLHLVVLGRQVQVGLLEPRLGQREVVGHAVEGIDEHADLVVRPHLDPVAQVTRGHLARPLGEELDGVGDAAGEVEAKPGRGEDDDQGEEQEEQDVDALDGVPQELELLVLLERLADAAQARLEPLPDVTGHHQGSHHLPVGGADGGDRLDHVPVLDLLDRRHLLPGEPRPELVLRAEARGRPGQGRVDDVDDLRPLARVHGDGGHPEALPLIAQVAGQHLAVGRSEQALPLDGAGDEPRVAEGGALERLVVRLGDLEGVVEGPLHLRLEPALDRRVDEVGGDDEDQDAGGEGQREKGEHQLGLEPRAQHPLPPLEGELDQVAEQQHQQQQQDDQVQVEQREHEQVRGDRELRLPVPELGQGGHHEHQQHRADDDEISPAPALVARQRHHCLRCRVMRGERTQSVSSASPAKRDTQVLTPPRAASARRRT